MKDWIMELCPEIQEWQAELIAEHTQKLVEAEREACAIAAWSVGMDLYLKQHDAREIGSACARAIRARGVK